MEKVKAKGSDVLLAVTAGLGAARLLASGAYWVALARDCLLPAVLFFLRTTSLRRRSDELLPDWGSGLEVLQQRIVYRPEVSVSNQRLTLSHSPDLLVIHFGRTRLASPPTPRGDPSLHDPFPPHHLHGSIGSHRQHTAFIMKGTSLLSFKAWPKIHQPLPRTPRESQQLLNALTSSFRRQLDRTYPSPNTTGQTSDRPPLNTESSAHATDQHLHSILDNPLFRIVPQKMQTVDRDPNSTPSTQRSENASELPMVLFDQAFAAGTATPAFITDCLKSQLLLARSSGEKELRNAMKITRAGSKVANWFWASDGASRQSLLHNRASTGSLTKFMVAESLQDTVLEWLKMLLTGDLGGVDGNMTLDRARVTFNHLLQDLLDAEIRYGAGLSSAITYYLRARRLQILSGELHADLKAAKSLLLAPGAQLARTLEEQKPSPTELPIHIFNDYAEIISALSSSRSLLYSSVTLCHPTHPDPTPFIHYVDSLSPKKFQKWSVVRQDAFLRISCDALRSLIDRKKIRVATNLGHQIQELLPEETAAASIGASRSRVTEEEDHLLQRLNMSWA